MANNALNAATNTTSNLASQAGLTSTYTEGHKHTSPFPPDVIKVSEVQKMDSVGWAVSEEGRVRHEVLVKITQLALFVSFPAPFAWYIKKREAHMSGRTPDMVSGRLVSCI